MKYNLSSAQENFVSKHRANGLNSFEVSGGAEIRTANALVKSYVLVLVSSGNTRFINGKETKSATYRFDEDFALSQFEETRPAPLAEGTKVSVDGEKGRIDEICGYYHTNAGWQYYYKVMVGGNYMFHFAPDLEVIEETAPAVVADENPAPLPQKDLSFFDIVPACVSCGADSVSNHIYCPECLVTWEMDNLLHSWTLIVLCPPENGAGVIETKLTDISKRQAVAITESLIKQFYAGRLSDDQTESDWKQLNFYTHDGYNVATLDLA